MIALKYWREILLAISIVVIYSLAFWVQSLEKENEVKESNIEALTTDIKTYKSANGKNVSEVKALRYEKSEFKAREIDLVRTIKQMKLKQNSIVSIAKIGIQNSIQIKLPLKDSAVKKLPSFISDSIKCFHYQDQFNKLNGCIIRDTVDIVSSYTDSLIWAASIIPKHRFLWWQWGNKGIKINAELLNPNSNITYLKYIEIVK
jgi:hypothetical protein